MTSDLRHLLIRKYCISYFIKLLLIRKASVFVMVTKGIPESDTDISLVHGHVGFVQNIFVYSVLVDGPDCWHCEE